MKPTRRPQARPSKNGGPKAPPYPQDGSKNGGSRSPPRPQDARKNGGSKPSAAPPPDTGKTGRFSRPTHMATAKSQVDKKRQTKIDAAVQDFAGVPPADDDLIEIRIVIPGGSMLPRGLDDPASLDVIRRRHQVWITRVEPNVLSVCGPSMPDLRRATQAIFDTLHDMRLANETSYTRFMVQKPCRHTFSAPIRLDESSRPVMQVSLHARGQPRDSSRAIDALATNISTEFSSSIGTLQCCGGVLRMRVRFGHLAILQEGLLKEKMTLDEFAREFKIHSTRGLARFDTWQPNAHIAGQICRQLIEPERGPAICPDRESVRRTYSLIVTMDNSDVLLDAFVTPHATQLSPIGTLKRGESSCFNCTVAAPDMTYDWSLQVDPFRVSREMPANIADLVRAISLEVSAPTDLELSLPRLTVTRPAETAAATWKGKVAQTKLRSSTIIPIQDTPYAAEVSVMQQWPGLQSPQQPVEAEWRLEIYGVHWDGAMNEIRSGQRKDWAATMESLWPGTGPKEVATSFRAFLQAVLDVQAALADMDATEM